MSENDEDDENDDNDKYSKILMIVYRILFMYCVFISYH